MTQHDPQEMTEPESRIYEAIGDSGSRGHTPTADDLAILTGLAAETVASALRRLVDSYGFVGVVDEQGPARYKLVGRSNGPFSAV